MKSESNKGGMKNKKIKRQKSNLFNKIRNDIVLI